MASVVPFNLEIQAVADGGHGESSNEAEKSQQSSESHGDQCPSFEVVIQLFHKKIYNLIYRLVGNADEAADLTQETFVRAFNAFPRFKGTLEAVYPWLCQIAVNGCKNKFRELGRRQQYETILPSDGETEEIAADIQAVDESSNPAGIIERQELETKIQEAIQALPPEFRLVVVLRDMQGLSYKEISDITGMTVEAVKTRLFRGRLAIRRRLSSYLGIDLS